LRVTRKKMVDRIDANVGRIIGVLMRWSRIDVKQKTGQEEAGFSIMPALLKDEGPPAFLPAALPLSAA